jgi:hypothetical protein
LEEKCDGCLIDLREWYSADQEYVQSVDAILKERGVSTDLLTATNAPIQIFLFNSPGAGGIGNTLFPSPPPTVEVSGDDQRESPPNDRPEPEYPGGGCELNFAPDLVLPAAIALAIPIRRRKKK